VIICNPFSELFPFSSMDEGDLSSNPFAALFPNISVAQCYVESHGTTKPVEEEDSIEMEVGVAGPVEPPKDDEVQEVQELNNMIEEIFLVTLNKFSVLGGDEKQLVYLSSLAEIIGKQGLILSYRVITSSLFQAPTTKPG
jgi:hypothetical protein